MCELTSCAEETACEKSPVESLMDVNARLLLSSALSLQTARKKEGRRMEISTRRKARGLRADRECSNKCTSVFWPRALLLTGDHLK